MNTTGISNLGISGAAASGELDQRLSLDVQGVDALRRTARSSPQEGMKQASRQFEALFMQMMLKSMRDATSSESMFSSSQEKTYTSMLDQQLSQSLSGRGLGLAEAMFTQLSRTKGSEATQPAISSGKQMPGAGPLSTPLASGAEVHASAQVPDLSFYEKATAEATMSRSILPQAHVEQFMSRMLPAAQRASQASGVPAQLIMAQAALESGWGKREIRTGDGKTSFNVFGIKADKSWKGPVVEAATTEYVNGVAQKTQARFRAYSSYDESFADYARFMTSNPRYANVLATPDPAQAAHGLQRAGYATDPNYGGKLVRIMAKMT
jgi:flagellar protein FlgJ